MNINFYKYQGTGNDFVMIDDRDEKFPVEDQQLVAHLCHRRFGIGADGLILLRNKAGYDFEMVYFNADGRLGSMCGNGGRCTVAFAKFLGVIQNQTRFLAADGDHEATIENGLVSLKMNEVNSVECGTDFYFMNTGSPHYVTFGENVAQENVFEKGRSIRYNERFKQEGTNVNFAEMRPDKSLYIRTYERGVEDETYSCGTGVTASALAASLKGLESPVKIETPGGNLQVSFKKQGEHFTDIYLTGPAEQVFKGEFLAAKR
ncbi:diaminopimelate epimerase [Adhaeribacter sp. BT258]|uniref:Diaminopimelate epimerase n=1 Tax=Adhaeribacter terrigena TaxID=2793070 RepID=A0ABS1BWF2_9BACT|nr:diaminopimelate epimerase [Adhaeribacter terrigena]MBK0401443.1 diaminopimelate epimerase [Adhaeribacter terrigena]